MLYPNVENVTSELRKRYIRAQVSSNSSAYKAYKICHFGGLIKTLCYSLRFQRKAPTKKEIR